ncbi:MAG: hypothetical protein QM722_21020 [Piscinibacter sp.]
MLPPSEEVTTIDSVLLPTASAIAALLAPLVTALPLTWIEAPSAAAVGVTVSDALA